MVPQDATPRIETLSEPLDPLLLEEVAEILTRGGLAVLPTDTVYGLCVSPESDTGLRHLFQLKRRDPNNPVPLFAADIRQARTIARFDPIAERLAARFWPGALTLALPRRPGFDWDLGGDPNSIGIRVPNSPFLRQLCERVGVITGTSANLSGEPPALSVEEAANAFGTAVDIYVDGGKAASSVPSTVVAVGDRVEILRQGAIPAEEILQATR